MKVEGQVKAGQIGAVISDELLDRQIGLPDKQPIRPMAVDNAPHGRDGIVHFRP